jgi:hypothetical protein
MDMDYAYLRGAARYDRTWVISIVSKFVGNHARATEIAWSIMGFHVNILLTLLTNGSPLWERYKALVKLMTTRAARHGWQVVQDILARENTTQVCSAVWPIYGPEWYFAVNSALTSSREAFTLNSRYFTSAEHYSPEGLLPTGDLFGDEFIR